MPLLRLVVVAVLALAACKKDPTPSELAHAKGDELYAKDDYAGAAKAFDESIALDAKQPVKDYEKAAFSHMKAGNFDRSAELLLATLSQKTDAAGKIETYKNVAGMYMQSAGRPDKAEEFFQKAFELDPKDDQTLAWLAELSSQQGGARATKAEADPKHLDKALERYDALIALTPNVPAPYVNKRIVLLKYVEHLGRLKAEAEKSAEENKDDKQVAGDFLDTAKKHQARAEELKLAYEDVSKKLGEVMKAQKKK